jgi:LPXTG-site transpeptidase (sortase) family protein
MTVNELRERLRNVDRKVAIAGLILAGSTLLLVIGLVSILIAVNDDNVGLPSEGSLEDILDEHQGVTSYGVIADREARVPPVRLAIPRINVDAPVVPKGLDSQHYPEVPDSGSDVAWYTFSDPPGRGSNAVFSGHVDWIYWEMALEGVFYHLRELQLGDEIRVDMDDGESYLYRVTGNVAVGYDDPNVVQVMEPTSKDVITLITCGGSWIKDYSAVGGNYSHRVIVRAERVQEDFAAGTTGG